MLSTQARTLIERSNSGQRMFDAEAQSKEHLLRESVRDSLDACVKQGHTKVDQQSESAVGELQICKKLRGTHSWHTLHSFQRHYHCCLHDEIDPILHGEPSPLVVHRNRNLPLRTQPPLSELYGQALFVDRLEQPGP